MSKDTEIALTIIKEILDLPELQVSREALEGDKIVEIVKHALERQYLLGAIGVDPKSGEIKI